MALHNMKKLFDECDTCRHFKCPSAFCAGCKYTDKPINYKPAIKIVDPNKYKLNNNNNLSKMLEQNLQ